MIIISSSIILTNCIISIIICVIMFIIVIMSVILIIIPIIVIIIIIIILTITCRIQNPDTPRVGSGGARRGGWAGRARQDWTPTGLFAQDTTVPRALQGIEDNCPEQLFGSTNKGNPM